MRTSLRFALASLTLVAVAGAVAACADARATESATDADIKRDLELASATTLALAGRAVDSANLSALETKPASAPEEASVVKRGSGSRAVRSSSPTVRAAADEMPAAEDLEGESLAEESVPDHSEAVAEAPVPTPVVVAPAGDYGSGGGMFGDGSGRIGGGGSGVVIRGGGVDGDNCELHRRGRGTSRGPVYVPMPRSQPVSTRPTTVSTRPSRDGISIGSRNPGSVSRRPSSSTARPSSSSPGPSRMDPRTARRGLN